MPSPRWRPAPPRNATAEFADLDAAGALLADGVGSLWPGAVAAVGVGDHVARQWVFGAAQELGGPPRPMTVDTVFDLASLTKVLATAPAVLRLVDVGVVGLDDPAARWVRGVDPAVTVAHLLIHTSGLPANMVPAGPGPDELVAAAAVTPLESVPGARVVYSDVGFVLLGGLIASVTGSRLDAAVQSLVFDPLGVALTYAPPADTAATEIYDGAATVGVVHDEKAAAAGGIAGHAGVFGALADVVGSLPAWLGGALLSDAVRAAALRDHTPDLDGHRGLGWTARGDRWDILSSGWGPDAVSHTGFTGTSVALDPVSGRWAVLLTNQVHYGRGRAEVFAARRHWHALLIP